MRLNDFRDNAHSQCGQDGVIAKALEILGVSSGYCVEFGAWDGLYLSNTRRFLKTPLFGGCLIEADPARFGQLAKLYDGRPDITTVNSMVDFKGENSLDNILKRADAPEDFDVLSIDIDSDDYHVWNSLFKFKPKLVLIETNPYFPFFIEYIQKPKLGRFPSGASVVSMYKLARSKGYMPVAYIGHDWLFVREDLYHNFDLDVTSCVGLFLEGTEIKGKDLMPHGEIIDLPTGPASSRSLDVHKFIHESIEVEFGSDLTNKFKVLTSPNDFRDLI